MHKYCLLQSHACATSSVPQPRPCASARTSPTLAMAMSAPPAHLHAPDVPLPLEQPS